MNVFIRKMLKMLGFFKVFKNEKGVESTQLS